MRTEYTRASLTTGGYAVLTQGKRILCAPNPTVEVGMRSVEITEGLMLKKRQRFWLKVHYDPAIHSRVVSTTGVPADISVGMTTSRHAGLHADRKNSKTDEKSLVLVEEEIGCCHLRKRPENEPCDSRLQTP